mmetsp:Transcript_13870/g.49240  ORF Transcript_13870/g.49240 Transcript_13870/m.49240 type:complete len:241 (+) Transcript_13870:1288-2010(+)
MARASSVLPVPGGPTIKAARDTKADRAAAVCEASKVTFNDAKTFFAALSEGAWWQRPPQRCSASSEDSPGRTRTLRSSSSTPSSAAKHLCSLKPEVSEQTASTAASIRSNPTVEKYWSSRQFTDSPCVQAVAPTTTSKCVGDLESTVPSTIPAPSRFAVKHTRSPWPNLWYGNSFRLPRISSRRITVRPKRPADVFLARRPNKAMPAAESLAAGHVSSRSFATRSSSSRSLRSRRRRRVA